MNTTARFQIHVPAKDMGSSLEQEIEVMLLGMVPDFVKHTALGKRQDEETKELRADLLNVYTLDVEDGYRSGPEVQNVARRIAEKTGQAVYVVRCPITGSPVTA